MCLGVKELDPFYFLSTPGLAWQADLKKDRNKIRSFNRY